MDELFFGEPDRKYGVEQAAEGEEGEVAEKVDEKIDENLDEETKEKLMMEKPLTEIERLAVVVKSIVHDCLIVPKGLFKLTPNHELRVNNSFIFTPIAEEADDLNEGGIGLEDWLHFRYVDSKQKRDLLNLGESI